MERMVSFTVVGNSKAELKHTVTAASACAAGGDLARTATATQTVATEVMTFPALMLEMVDKNAPVPVGKEEVDTIAVRNQGSGPDEDVKIVVERSSGAASAPSRSAGRPSASPSRAMM